MHQQTTAILSVLLLGFVFLDPVKTSAQPQRAYERGLEELYRGNVSQALDTWYNSYSNQDSVDSRIGFEYIRVVTEREMRPFFESATDMYLRALTDGEGNNSRIALRQEIERMRPIIGEGIYRQWMEWWNNRDKRLGPDMRGYWAQQDPTPAKPSNERLIEHWERIANTRRHFTKDNNTVYGTDDRALIYIRYGEPDRSKNGILTLQSTNIRQWLERQLQESPDGDAEERTLHNETLRDQEFTHRILDAMYRYHRYPEYEIWFYDGLADDQLQPVIFMFGTDVRNDRFRLQTSLEDFIPERAFNPERDRGENELQFTRAGITPALMLQLLYYEQLVQIDPFFENRLNELRDRLLEQNPEVFTGLDLSFRSETSTIINKRVSQSPRERSSYEAAIPRIPLQVYHYRFIDDNHEPYMLVFIESSAFEAFMIDYHRNRGRNNGDDTGIVQGENVLDAYTYYELTHNLITYSDGWVIENSKTDNPVLIASRNSTPAVSESVFRVPHTRRAFLSASVGLMNYEPESTPVVDTPFPVELRGWNKHQFRQPPPLKSATDSLEVADLVLGYLMEEEHTEPFPFVVANNQIVPFGETLMLHFQVYNLERMYNGFTQFELTYRIYPVDDQGNVLTDQTEFILTLNFINEETTVIENLEIETANLTPGLYELHVYINDTESEQSKERNIRFEVFE